MDGATRSWISVQDGVREVADRAAAGARVASTFKPENTVITIGDLRIGGDEVVVMAGPCSAERQQVDDGSG